MNSATDTRSARHAATLAEEAPSDTAAAGLGAALRAGATVPGARIASRSASSSSVCLFSSRIIAQRLSRHSGRPRSGWMVNFDPEVIDPDGNRDLEPTAADYRRLGQERALRKMFPEVTARERASRAAYSMVSSRRRHSRSATC